MAGLSYLAFESTLKTGPQAGLVTGNKMLYIVYTCNTEACLQEEQCLRTGLRKQASHAATKSLTEHNRHRTE
jgi:hypothetical protein